MKTNRLRINGVPNEGQERIWTVTAWIELSGGVKERVSISIKRKIALSGLADEVIKHLTEVKKEFDQEVADFGFTAIAR